MGIGGKEVMTTGSEHNTLAFGTKVVGDIHAENDFRLDGSVEGTIVCKGKIIVGPKGVMSGTMTCANADVLGVVKGKVIVSDTLSLKSTAKVEGEITTKTLSIEPNAIFTGTCDMTNGNKQIVSNNQQQKA
ncbi:MAG: polymer-forming cytoskeletal protein [Paludibacteraceae bacterium]|nr:polymer-forming cytoskeletal protein [Paludibacteraceae bacterium]MBR4712836.1 polymer-forming cytoskeletal protein [Paludibacteraceae bacterium]MBR5373052.1 polymer-forming cytoskeletal protein [Paludibacteraceae bacterium]